jgi:hypothetical protein
VGLEGAALVLDEGEVFFYDGAVHYFHLRVEYLLFELVLKRV